MAKGHAGDDGAQDEPTGRTNDTRQLNRRSMMKAVGATAALAGLGGFSMSAAAEQVSFSGGDVTIPAGEYEWDGSGLENSSGEGIVGGGDPGDVVLNLESGTMSGLIGGRLENITVRGANHESKAGINLEPGATVDGFVWPEGGQQSEDRAFYTPEGGDDRLTVRNTAIGFCTSDSLYLDKPPVTAENCVLANNNISNLRLGHRDGTSDPESTTSYARNCTIAVTRDVQSDDSNNPNARGLHIKQPGRFVIENCHFVYKDVSGIGNPVEIDSESGSPTITFRNCHFYNDSDRDLFKDETDGAADVTIEDCTIAGSGSDSVGVDYSGSGFTSESVAVPLPSTVTGMPAADEIEGIGEGIEPWDSSAESTSTDDSLGHTMVLHASPDNTSAVDVSFTVTGGVEFATEAEPDTDTIVTNDDGTVTATSVGLDPDALDSYRFDGEVVDYSVPDGAVVDVSVDGTTTTFQDLVGEDSTTDTTTDTETDTTTDTETETDTTADTETDTTTDTTTDDGSGGTLDDGSTSDTTLPHRATVTGSNAEDPTAYTFTVSGDCARDEAASVSTDDGSPWDSMEDIAQDGKVIGLVGSGVDAYRFDGNITELTVDGDADLSIERNV